MWKKQQKIKEMDYQIQTLIAEKQEQANTITALKNRIK